MGDLGFVLARVWFLGLRFGVQSALVGAFCWVHKVGLAFRLVIQGV